MMNPMQLFNFFQQFMTNPQSALSSLGVPQQAASNPQAAIQYLMNSGKMSQQQYKQLSELKNRLQNNPQFMSFFGNH